MAALDLATLDIASLQSEVEGALATAVSALDVVDKFAAFVSPSVAAELTTLVSVLTALENIVSKV